MIVKSAMVGNKAECVRDVPTDEPESQTVHDAKALTFDAGREHAVLRIQGGRRILVRGGRYGIDLERRVRNDPFGREADQVIVRIEGGEWTVERLEFHVHPAPTGGPSDDDLLMLELLRQEESVLYELFGPAEGTVIRPKSRGVEHGH